MLFDDIFIAYDLNIDRYDSKDTIEMKLNININNNFILFYDMIIIILFNGYLSY